MESKCLINGAINQKILSISGDRACNLKSLILWAGCTKIKYRFYNILNNIIWHHLKWLFKKLWVSYNGIFLFSWWWSLKMLDFFSLWFKNHEKNTGLDFIASSNQVLRSVINNKCWKTRPNCFCDSDRNNLCFSIVSVKMKAWKNAEKECSQKLFCHSSSCSQLLKYSTSNTHGSCFHSDIWQHKMRNDLLEILHICLIWCEIFRVLVHHGNQEIR